ncbi:hypothetical protein ACLESD_26030 [Pyxidicoccus sp. 3LFB2]
MSKLRYFRLTKGMWARDWDLGDPVDVEGCPDQYRIVEFMEV